ncbi:hypothetical protein AJ80_06334 [Polytolypa hystricis UAMH7299]|uniref:Uncharacterized protein n=1 Tax=Polytolypa hystricis (strain UAMH7299) TaxID=1447883 RepID=A0A2B7XX01_POLH7|nr:hypothetical protein AJ80_06334 [Polytolypa hystricis UAMH7299]
MARASLGVAGGDPPPPSYEETIGIVPPTAAAPAAATRAQPAPDLSSITIDGTLIYPTLPPATALYELSHDLDAGFNKVDISRLVPRTTDVTTTSMNPRDKLIYEFKQVIFSTTVEITGRRRSAVSGTLYLKPRIGLLKQGWEVWHTPASSTSSQRVGGGGHPDALLFRLKGSWNARRPEPLRWEDASGSLVALETVWQRGEDNSRPRLQILSPLPDGMMDILVTAWCARIWIGQQLRLAEERERGVSNFRRRMAYSSGVRRDLYGGSGVVRRF